MKCFTRLKLNSFTLAAVLFAGGFFSSLGATTLYVATNGNDSNPGTQSAPFRTISKGISVMNPGDILYMRGGTYSAHISSVPQGGSWSNASVISGYPGETAILSGSMALGGSSSSYVIFKDFIIDGSNVSGKNELVWVGEGANHISFVNTEIRNNPNGQNLVQVNKNASFIEFLGGSIHDSHGSAPISTTTNGFYGLYMSGKDNLIDGVKFYNCVGYAVHIYVQVADHPGASSDRNVIRNCYVHNTRPTTGTNWSVGILLGAGANQKAYNNIIAYIQGGPGVEVGYGASGALVANNTMYSNGDGVWIGNASSTRLQNNIIYQSGSISNSGSGTISSNNLFSDPKFVNASAADFHLQSTSPAIGAGVAVSGITTDFEGKPRPNPPSIGAYEPGSGGTPPPTSEPLPPPTGVIVVQSRSSQPTQPPVYQQPSSQPSGPSTSQVAIPFLIAGVIGAALLLGD